MSDEIKGLEDDSAEQKLTLLSTENEKFEVTNPSDCPLLFSL
jgi:hypothetical protein